MMRPFYRSRLFWLGVPGLVFLVWLWVDSFWHVSSASRDVWVKLPRNDGTGYVGSLCALQQGSVTIGRGSLPDATREMATTAGRLDFHRGDEGYFRPGVSTLWGMRSKDERVFGYCSPLGMGGRSSVTVRWTERWFHIGFVVLGYVAVWMGSVVLWRRAMRRRWRATQEAGEGKAVEVC
jgi:hypothetical protein